MIVLPLICEVMQMTVTVEEMKSYLRVDFEDDDSLIENFITAAKKQCMDILRTDDEGPGCGSERKDRCDVYSGLSV